ncbi:unnamed protein product [Adineta ricciae]|uniref:Uncharacterized protein n=1 Tax=Adineta ricciae TaxID=249248 RepID=A0A814H3E2_ADIRI|nr:unnamed protein product [Adineta ricciae]CAF1004351.1 unnamed protein product [Adineta ricciae]
MPSKFSSSSTSTSDLYQRNTTCSDSSSQTVSKDNIDEGDDDYADYEQTHLQKPSVIIPENPSKKSDQATLCRTNRYSVGCWTKPAYLLPN